MPAGSIGVRYGSLTAAADDLEIIMGNRGMVRDTKHRCYLIASRDYDTPASD